MTKEMVQRKAQIEDILSRICDANGGGQRVIEITPGRYGGFYVTLVWDGVAKMSLDQRMNFIAKALIDGIGTGAFHIVKDYGAVSFQEKAEEDAIAAATPQDLPWLAAQKY